MGAINAKVLKSNPKIVLQAWIMRPNEKKRTPRTKNKFTIPALLFRLCAIKLTNKRPRACIIRYLKPV
jgi:hypothetical protein